MDPVGTMYASTSVALSERAIKMMIAKERISRRTFDNIFISSREFTFLRHSTKGSW
jgi:hypothetical protein